MLGKCFNSVVGMRAAGGPSTACMGDGGAVQNYIPFYCSLDGRGGEGEADGLTKGCWVPKGVRSVCLSCCPIVMKQIHQYINTGKQRQHKDLFEVFIVYLNCLPHVQLTFSLSLSLSLSVSFPFFLPSFLRSSPPWRHSAFLHSPFTPRVH